ncbi:DUF6482 family protein [Vibrio maerlii]|uniref:DUF6482 family protein n=1 Tax=Vibrio maerlii TaxID=2231648 RepID=UPI000E3BA319|nr:DUF6482 family protein [Vibrio maerlii]
MNLLVESLEGDIYLAFEVQGDRKQALLDNQNKPIKFHSLKQIRDYCEGMSIDTALLQHNSAYDEMCGSQSMGQNSMTIDLKWY